MGFTVKFGDGSGTASKGCLTLFFLVFLAAGLLFTGLMAMELVQQVRQRDWPAVPCTIVRSGVGGESTDGSYAASVEYRYEWQGRALTSSVIKTGYSGSESWNDAQSLVDAYPAGAASTCYVNPANPVEAVLDRGSLWFGLILLIPLIFVAIGAGGIWFAWRKRRPEAERPISSRAPGSGAAARWVPVAVFAVFFLVGAGVFVAFCIPMYANYLAARDWTPTPCTIIVSEVQSHSGSKGGTTYNVHILYEYEVAGKTYRRDRYTFMGGSSSGREGKAAVVDAHPAGSKAVCYRNPANPRDAVFDRGWQWEYLLGLIPLVFVLGGAGGFIGFTRKALREKAREWRQAVAQASAGPAPGLPSDAARRSAGTSSRELAGLPKAADFEPGRAFEGPVEMKPSVSPGFKLGCMLLPALFWNGIVSMFVAEAVDSWVKGDTAWFLTIFLIPFVVVGLVLLVACGYFFLALFNPRPQLTASARAVPLGGSLDLSWKIPGLASRIKRLRIRVEGREEATYRRGTSTTTDKHVFARIVLADTRSPFEIRNGRATLRVPGGLMHTFESPNNKIVWTLHVAGEIERWPDVSEEYSIVVLPAGG